MHTNSNLESILSQTFFGIDTLTIFSDLEDFILFSESSLIHQKQQEIQRVNKEFNKFYIRKSDQEHQYMIQIFDNIEYRFEISLKQRIRYAALVSLITTIEWVLLSLKKRVLFPFPKKPKEKNEAIYTLEVFNEQAKLNLKQEIILLESLTQIRNCIVHAAGLLASYKHESKLRDILSGELGIRVSNRNFLGDSIEIEAEFLEGVVKNVRIWITELEKNLLKHRLISK